MADAVIPPYPPSLTTKSWDKAKGLLARISRIKTGVTELLTQAEEAFKDMPWERATSVSQLAAIKLKGPAAMKEFQRDYLSTYQPKFRKLQSVYADLSNDLNQKAATFEQDPKLVKFAPVLRKMASDADKFTYAVAWGTISDGVQKEILRIEKEFAERAQKAQEHIGKIVPALEKVIKKLGDYKTSPPTTREYSGLFAQYHRLPGTYIGVAAKDVPGLKDTFKDFLAYASKHWTDEPAAKTDMAKMVKADLEQLKKAKELAEQL